MLEVCGHHSCHLFLAIRWRAQDIEWSHGLAQGVRDELWGLQPGFMFGAGTGQAPGGQSFGRFGYKGMGFRQNHVAQITTPSPGHPSVCHEKWDKWVLLQFALKHTALSVRSFCPKC